MQLEQGRVPIEGIHGSNRERCTAKSPRREVKQLWDFVFKLVNRMATSEELVLSDVHMGEVMNAAPDNDTGTVRIFESRFYCDDEREDSRTANTAALRDCEDDDDGDLVLPRKRRKLLTYRVLHSMSTTINDVGLQVWAGALVMADFVLSKREEFKGKAILELGAGAGLVAAVAARTINLNCDEIYRSYSDPEAGASKRKKSKRKKSSSSSSSSSSSRSTNDSSGVEILLAADVVYVDEWTTSFAHAAHQLLSHLFTTPRSGSITAADNTTTTTTTDTTQRASSDGGGGGGRSRSTPASGSGSSTAQSAAKSSSAQKQQTPTPTRTRTRTRTRTLFLTIEKRINFSLDDLAPAAPAYEHFVREMVQSPLFNATRLPIDFAQRFQGYTRVPQLELWMFTSAGGADR
eukprot:gene5283-16215_t